MKNKRFLAMVLTAAILFTLIPISVAAAERHDDHVLYTIEAWHNMSERGESFIIWLSPEEIAHNFREAGFQIASEDGFVTIGEELILLSPQELMANFYEAGLI